MNMMKKFFQSDNLFHTLCLIFLTVTVIICIMPFLLLVIISFTDEISVAERGYSFFPTKTSLNAYFYIFARLGMIARAYGVTIFVTAFGTFANVLLTTMYAYPLSRHDYPWKGVQTVFLFIPMMISGGIVPSYLMYTQVFHIRDTIWGLIVPNLMFNAFNVILLRTYFKSNVPYELIESAKLDGAGEMRIFRGIVLPLSTPIIATVALFSGLAYWNDWMNGLYYLMDSRLYSLQVYLNRILTDIQFLNTDTSQASQYFKLNVPNVNLPTTTVRMAIAVVSVAPVLVIFLLLQKYFTKGIAIGAVKG